MSKSVTFNASVARVQFFDPADSVEELTANGQDWTHINENEAGTFKIQWTLHGDGPHSFSIKIMPSGAIQATFELDVQPQGPVRLHSSYESQFLPEELDTRLEQRTVTVEEAHLDPDESLLLFDLDVDGHTSHYELEYHYLLPRSLSRRTKNDGASHDGGLEMTPIPLHPVLSLAGTSDTTQDCLFWDEEIPRLYSRSPDTFRFSSLSTGACLAESDFFGRGQSAAISIFPSL
ncbi:hypothetical protein HDU91_005989 [Kappamyces sp. JEL0680]|nr:hypothetical protein HDU91_005989 [Kappamyces sp. JEL0680]